MMRTGLVAVAVAIALSALGTWASAAFAQDYPTRPIKVVVPQPPGGGFDRATCALFWKLAPGLEPGTC